MKDAHNNSLSSTLAARVGVAAGAIAVCLAATISSALAACPAPKSEAEHIASGAVVFTGRVRAIGSKASTGLPAYYDFDVVDGAERTLRVHTPDSAMYTASFEKGRLYRVVASRGDKGLSTYACVNRPL